MKKVTILVLFFCLTFLSVCFAQTSASQMQRAQEILEKEEALRKRLQEPKKVFIKDIVVEGVTLLSEDEIKKVVSVFLSHWLTQEDFQQIEELLKQAYREKGYTEQPAEILRQIKKKSLIIKIKE